MTSAEKVRSACNVRFNEIAQNNNSITLYYWRSAQILLQNLSRFDSQTGLVKLPPLGKLPSASQLAVTNFERSSLHKHRMSHQVQEMIADVV